MAASNINRVVLTGNLTFDPELRALPSGTAVCKLRIASNTRRKNNQTNEWEDKPNYFDVTVWGAQGENCAKYLSKGRPVAIDGRLEWRQWEDQQGNKRQAVEIIADTVQFLGGGERNEGGGYSGGGQASGGGQQGSSFTPPSDIPADTSDFAPSSPAPVGGGMGSAPAGDDDIPF
jgi:single-strand DNA-binding protein